MQVDKNIVFNLILDMRKNAVDKFERTKIIKAYLRSEDISMSELGRRMGVSPSTIESWMVYDKIEKKEYNRLITQGYGDTQIFKALKSSPKNLTKYFDDRIDNDIRNCMNTLERYIPKRCKTTHTLLLLADLESIIRRLKNRL